MTQNQHQPRILLVDDNIRDEGGHFFELGTLLLEAGQEIGYQPVLATHAKFRRSDLVPSDWRLLPTFNTRRLVRWSLGVDGQSNFHRDLNGKPQGGTIRTQIATQLRDQIRRRSRRPSYMLSRWSRDFTYALNQTGVQENDQVIINTCDDFAWLALARSLASWSGPPLSIHTLFHFAIFQSDDPGRDQLLHEYTEQINLGLEQTRRHQLHVHATTDSLAEQMMQAKLNCEVNVIPYPTRLRQPPSRSHAGPIKIVLAGLPRAEKGRQWLQGTLAGLEPDLRAGRFQISMQMPRERWRSYVPESLQSDYEQALGGHDAGPLQIMTDNLSTDDYHRWLDSADVGLFLYQPQRYEARCSGVLLEMMVRGVPVVVPDRCWLAKQTQRANDADRIGFVYGSPSEIPRVMRQLHESYVQIAEQSREHAKHVRNLHSATNTLSVMGIPKLIAHRCAA